MGKHIAYLEIYKVVPTLLLHFDVSVTAPWRQSQELT